MPAQAARRLPGGFAPSEDRFDPPARGPEQTFRTQQTGAGMRKKLLFLTDARKRANAARFSPAEETIAGLSW